MRKTTSRAWELIVAATVFIALMSVLQHQFVSWDDDGFLYLNPHFRGLGWSQLSWMFSTFLKGPYQPLVWLSYAADYLLWGMDPAGFHLTSLLWHCANAALVFLFCRNLFATAAPDTTPASRNWAAAFAALCFALHPLRAEAVAWASARRDLMSGFFFLCALLFHLRGRAAGTFACYCLSLLCKPMGIGLPVVLWVLDKVILKRETRWQSLLPYALPAAAAAVLAWHGQEVTGAMRSAAVFGWPQRLAQAGYAHAFYIAKTLWPAGLSPIYEAALRLDPLAPRFLTSAALSLAAAAAAFVLRRRLPAVWAAWLSYLILLAPVLGAVKFGSQLVADRYSYLPCLSWSLLAAAALLELARRRPAWGLRLVVSGTVLVGLLSGLSERQLGFWKDSETLYRRVLAIEPGHFLAHNNLGLVLDQEGRTEEALEQFHLSLAARPRYAPALNNLGAVQLRLGLLKEAEAQFRAALESDPTLPESRDNLRLLQERRQRSGKR
jgi:tetratricopeptide (TPR) repeat protein